jgi:GNAT superfamily N-acetyltransferase
MDLLTSLGYAPIRVTYTMAIDLAAPPPAPDWPHGITIRNFIPGQDDHVAYEAYEEAFADMWQRPRGTFEQLVSKLSRPYFDPAHWFLAFDGDQVAGTLFSDNIDGKGWVEIVGVRRPWRGRGLALAMLHHAFGAFFERGVTHIGLSVDAQSPTGAPRIYERAGMHLDQSFRVYERELRPGFEVASQQHDE